MVSGRPSQIPLVNSPNWKRLCTYISYGSYAHIVDHARRSNSLNSSCIGAIKKPGKGNDTGKDQAARDAHQDAEAGDSPSLDEPE